LFTNNKVSFFAPAKAKRVVKTLNKEGKNKVKNSFKKVCQIKIKSFNLHPLLEGVKTSKKAKKSF